MRKHVVRMVANVGSGHPGGSLSATDILVALYFGIMRCDPGNPGWRERDRFILSKGHASPGLYATLAERGYFSTDKLLSFDFIDSSLQGHPDMLKTPGVDMSTGSLGQGLSVGAGMALAARFDGLDYRVFVLLGDGEIQEGQVWEAAMAAARYELSNLTAILDYNKLQLFGPVKELMPVEPLMDKWRSFGWSALEVDGHDMRALLDVLGAVPVSQDRPTAIIAHTCKGKGVSFMENRKEWHARAPSPEELAKALQELDEAT